MSPSLCPIPPPKESPSASVAVAVGACGDGFVAPRAGDECSNSIVLLAQTSSLVGNATISRTGVCKRTIRLDWLVRAPDWLLMDLIEHGECPWRLLACRAAYVKLGMLGKY